MTKLIFAKIDFNGNVVNKIIHKEKLLKGYSITNLAIKSNYDNFSCSYCADKMGYIAEKS